LTYTVRNATADDIPAMIRLERECPSAAHWSEQQYAGLLDEASGHRRLAIVSEDRQRLSQESPLILGFLVAHSSSPDWELENLVVALEVRGKGIGTGLMKDLFARARESGGESVFLEVRESNKAARALYENLGFQQSGRRKSYYSNPLEDALLYTRRLR